MIYLVCALLSSAVITAVCLPLFRKDDTLESAIIEETEWDLLQRKKEVVLGNIQDLDFEYKCGKLSSEDYQKIRSEMAAEAALVLEEIDGIETSHDLDALIRREIAARSKKSSPATLTCPSCEAINPVTNKFCADCGVKLKS
jgi:hypothetical protein